MLRTLIWFLVFWIYLIISLPVLLIVSTLTSNAKEEFLNKHIKNWAKTLIKLAGGDIEIIGSENIPDDAGIYIANHQGNFDIPIILAYVGKVRGFMSKSEIKKIPIINIWMKHIDCIFIDRQNVRGASVDGVKKLLLDNKSITIFPEGTRSKGENMKKFKKGAFYIARDTGSPIIPVSIDGSYKMMEMGKPYIIKPAKVYVTIHKPIYISSSDNLDVVAGETFNTIKNSLKA